MRRARQARARRAARAVADAARRQPGVAGGARATPRRTASSRTIRSCVIVPLALSRIAGRQGQRSRGRCSARATTARRAGLARLDEATLARDRRSRGITGAWRIVARRRAADALRATLARRRRSPSCARWSRSRRSRSCRRAVRTAYLAGALALVPTPGEPGVLRAPALPRSSRRELPRATQIPLLHLFPRIEGSCAIRIPQSGWLDEQDDRRRARPPRS